APLPLQLEPVVMKADAREFLAEAAERVDVAFADAPEVAKIDAQLVGGMSRLHESGLVDTEPLHEAADVRQGGFADADDPDVLAFDQLDFDEIAEQLGQGRRAHPSGGPAAEHDDLDRLRLVQRHLSDPGIAALPLSQCGRGRGRACYPPVTALPSPLPQSGGV